MKKYLFYALLSSFALFFSCSSLKQVSEKEKDLSYTTYLKKRNSLLKADSLLYFDNNVSLSQKEQKLNNQLIQLQQKMIADYKDNHFFPPARNFYVSKTHIEQTPLFSLLKKMPKGGILHLHSDAMGDARWMVEKAINTPEMYVYWEVSNDKFVKGQLHAYAKNTAPKGFQQVQNLAKENPHFSEEFTSLLTFDKSIDRDSVDVWGEFEKIFQRINGFISYKEIVVDYFIHGIDLLIADNIQHAELRLFFNTSLYDLTGNISSLDEYVELLEIIDVKAKQKDPEFTFNVIAQSLRFFDQPTIWKDIQLAHQYRQQYPRWIRGFDLVAEEDAGHTTLFHAKEFLKLDSLEQATGVTLPLYLHDGESSWASVTNLYDAVLLGTKRIGHGFNLFRFPNLIELVKKKDICIEVNPLSNQILGYLRDLRIHPASTYLRQGVNCVISSDDPLIFDYQGLTYDFWSIFMAWELDLAALKKLSRNSLEYSAMTEMEKVKALKVWEKRWSIFVEEALWKGVNN